MVKDKNLRLVGCKASLSWVHTDKKENYIFLIYKEIQNGAVAKSYMTKGLLIWGNICAFPFHI
jgi:hypothetical protein